MRRQETQRQRNELWRGKVKRRRIEGDCVRFRLYLRSELKVLSSIGEINPCQNQHHGSSAGGERFSRCREYGERIWESIRSPRHRPYPSRSQQLTAGWNQPSSYSHLNILNIMQDIKSLVFILQLKGSGGWGELLGC